MQFSASTFGRIILTFLIFIVAEGARGQSYQKRLALVIGNSNYQNGGVLPNPVNDARAMASALESVGFETMKFENVTQTQLKQAINSFGIKLKGYEVGLFYYAGHGIQHKGANYMIPVEADLQTEEQIEFDCVAADRILAFMEAASSKVNVIVMDACRNNPFERSWHRSANGGGLAMMDAPTGSLIAYATAPGRVASDGEASNGLYTSALLKYMKDPGLNIEQVFKRVRTEVTEKSFGAQVPWETTSLTGDDFFLNSKNDLNGQEKKKETDQTANNNITSISRSLENEGVNNEKALKAYSTATAKYEQVNYKDAIGDYSIAIEANPLYYEAYLWRGHSHYALKNYEAAILDYSKTIQLSPSEPDAYYYRGNSRYMLDKYSEAITDFTLTLKFDPKNATARYYRGLCYYAQKKYGAALDDFSNSISMSPDNALAWYNRANSQYGLEEYALAIEDYKKSTELNPAHSDSYLYMAHSYFNLKEYENALPGYSKAIELTPEIADTYYWRSNAYHQLNRMNEAKKDIDKAIGLDPANETYLNFKKEKLGN